MRTLLARHRADSLVCFGPGGSRDAAQFAAYALAIARALPSGGAGTRVVLACRDHYRFSASLAAIWVRGMTAELPVNGQPATVHALAASGALELLHDLDGESGLDVRALESESARESLPLELGLPGDGQAVIAYTSGSTGVPSAHVKTLDQLLREPETHLAEFDLPGRRVVAAVPPYHIYGLLFGVLVPLLGGGSMSRSAPLQPPELLRELEQAQADVLVAVPPHLGALAAHQSARWPQLHRVFSSGGPLPEATSTVLAERGLIVTEVLGSTETGGIAYRTSASAPWRPLPSVRVSVDGEQALCVDSPWLEPSAPRPVRTADRVELSSEGFRHLGRSDAVVKIGGRRVDLGELETRLRQQAGVRDARVLALESRGVRGLELVAVVEGDGIDVATLKRALVRHVDPVAVPRRYRVVPRLPRGPTGKVTRQELLALFDVATLARTLLADGSVRVVVPPNSVYFRGHFEELPILPGVVQLQRVALREVRLRYPELGRLSRMTRVKFKRPVLPGEALLLRLARKGPLLVQFTIDVEGHPAASGLLHFREHAP